MRAIVAGAIVVCSLSVWGCGGDGNPESPSPEPSPSPAPSPNVVTINIVAENGAQSFTPNPATLPAGQMVVWRNVDNTTHRVVLDNGSVDTGNLAPNASSQPMSVNNAGGPYHCTIHPSMVGTINPAAATGR